ncbi:DedA family protein [Thermobispora bispora]|uniref:SNARE associated Golgi protein-related protein n=1 Tax=Thermobispora bispora (strain ATCC 19993 / DSM 43833 / CBS 139.67 / JCM 10125 / KCTC 9307 / NBRC 14880 / R51) TaxID=469371 RepID=D6YB62_THEBD|nr:DedA family protein [Thermobispora bispora]ADG88422.1 SNARE associated Golgi protein-related protein [Thermobispora bispora DSM 43833]
MHVDEWLQAIPATWVYVLVGVIIALESLGIPLPGEIMLVSAALLSSQGVVSPVLVGVYASAGAIVGDSIGYFIGYKGGAPLFDRLGRRFPRHFGPEQIAKAERLFHRYGVWAVFFGRFVALLRILVGPLAGALRLPYWRFLVANVSGGIVWAGGTTAAIYYLGVVADRWLKGFSWAGLALAVAAGLITTVVVKRRLARAAAPAPAAPQRSMSVTSRE